MVMMTKYRLITIILVIVLAANTLQGVEALDLTNVSVVRYRIEREWAVIWINKDGSIEAHYNITITYESAAKGYITIGLPAKDFEVVSVKDLQGNALSYEDISSGSYYAIEAYFGHPMSPGESGTVLLIARVPNMLHPDEMNPGYVGMQFIPTFFDAWILNLRVAIVPPKEVSKEEIKTSQTAFYTTVDGNFALYWERNNIPPNTVLTFGISIPEKYITFPSRGPDIWLYLAVLCVLAAVVIAAIFIRRRKEAYEKPRVMVEALGPKRGLTSVEAAVVVGVKPVKVLTMILFGLLLKRIVSVEEIEPLLRLRRREEGTGKRYYEIDFLRAIEPDGSLNERLLAITYISLCKNVDRKMRGYSRADTVNYYRSVIAEAWKQVTAAKTPQLREDAIEKNIRWLLADENYEERFRKTFPPNILIIPRPDWYWYWYGPYLPKGPGTPSTRTPEPGEIKPIPAQEFADRVVSGLERAANNIVEDAEKFANSLLQLQTPPPTSEPVRSGSSCICACAHCACACACVSCACACAGGGAR